MGMPVTTHPVSFLPCGLPKDAKQTYGFRDMFVARAAKSVYLDQTFLFCSVSIFLTVWISPEPLVMYMVHQC